MKWSDIGQFIGKAAPLIGTVIGGPAGAGIGAMVAHALGTDNTPDAVQQALSSDPQALLKLKQLEADHDVELKRLVIENETRQLAEVNTTYRAELASNDPYVRRMRPTFGYVVAGTLAMQTLALVAGVAFAFWYKVDLSLILSGVKDIVDSVAMIDAPAMAVLGVYVKKRSDDKVVAKTGAAPIGFIKSLLKK